MKTKIVSFFVIVVLLSSCGVFKKAPKAPVNPLTNSVDSMSYALGVDMGDNIADNLKTIPGGVYNKELFIRAFTESLRGDSTMLLKKEEAKKYFTNYIVEAQKRENERKKKKNQEFLDQNKTKEGVKTTASGLQYKVLKLGNGEKPKATDKVKVHYTGKTIDGKVFDSSVERGTPAEFPLNGVIKGWTEGVQLMPVGSKFQFFIPYELAYGERGAGKRIAPFSTLIFEVELLDIIK